jgi:hypothetical protein
VAHVHRMRDEPTVVERDLDLLSSSWSIEPNDKCAPTGHKSLGGELHIYGTSVSVLALEIRGPIDLDPEFRSKGVLWGRSEDRLFYRVGSSDKEGTVKQE